MQRILLTIMMACLACPAAHGASAELKVQLGHSGSVLSAAFSPDGRWVLTGSDDHTARLWDLSSGREIRRFEGHTEGVSAVAFSPDGRFVLTGSNDTTARLWDLSSGREIRRFEGHSSPVSSVAFSPDARSLLTGSWDSTARLWDLSTGREIRRFVGSDVISSVAFSPDGGSLLAGSHDHAARLWDLNSGRELRRFVGHSDDVTSAAFSPDGRLILTGSADKTARLWDLNSGREIHRFEGHSETITSVAFSPDGRSVLTGSADKTARLWNPDDGREIRRFESDSGPVNSVAFSPNGHSLLTGSVDKTARMWDLSSGREIRRFDGRSDAVLSAAFSPDGRLVLTGSDDNTPRVWDLSGGQIRRFEGHSKAVESVAFSPDGRTVLTGSDDKTARLWDLGSGREIRRFEGHSNSVESVAFSPDGRTVLTGSVDRTARLWDLSSAQELRRFEGILEVNTVAFSPDGRSVLMGTRDETARLWDVSSGREIRGFDGYAATVESVAFSPDGRLVVIGSDDSAAQLWDVNSGLRIRRFEGHSGKVTSVAFSPDSRSVLTGSDDHTASLWDVSSGQVLRRFEGHSGVITSVAFSFDGRSVLTSSTDGTTKLWDTSSGRLSATLISFRDGGWAVVDPEGRYDASDPDNLPGLYWQVGEEFIELKQLKARFYTPNLLARTLGFNPEPLPEVAGLNDLQLWPLVQVNGPADGKSSATIRLTDRGGGIGRVVVKVNGREVPLATRGAAINADTDIPIDLSAAGLAADGENTIEVIAYDGKNLIAARGVTAAWKQSPAKASAPSVLHAIIVGISSYQDASMALTFPAKDAQDMAHALEVGARRMFGVSGTDIITLASGTAHEPTKENIRKAFEAIQAGPSDVVLVYLAGHGVAGKGGSDLYYYPTRDARTLKPEDDPDLWARTTISSAELLTWLLRPGMPLRSVVVLDTCAAGAAQTALLHLSDRRELTADQRRALELLKDATGSHILMGAAADKVSYEASRYGQGLLTYSLLLGMRGEALDEGGRLDVTKWFNAAQARVPVLAAGIGGIQQPVISSPGGQTFPIAMFTSADRAEVHLATLKPQLLRARVEDDDQNDPLNLDGPVREALRAASIPVTRGEVRSEPALVYLDSVAGDVADAFVPQVRYLVSGDKVQIRLRLVAGVNRTERNIEAATRDPGELSKRIVAEFLAMLAAAGTK